MNRKPILKTFHALIKTIGEYERGFIKYTHVGHAYARYAEACKQCEEPAFTLHEIYGEPYLLSAKYPVVKPSLEPHPAYPYLYNTPAANDWFIARASSGGSDD